MSALPPLIELVGTRWSLGAPLSAAAWAANGRRVAFALGDGTLAIASPSNSGPGAALHRGVAHGGACLALTAFGGADFLSGGDDGCVVRHSANGAMEVMARHPGLWIDHLVAGGQGRAAWAMGREIVIQGGIEEIRQTMASGVTALAFSAAGDGLAVAGRGGADVWSARTGHFSRFSTPGYCRSLAWSADGRYLAAGLQENAVMVWRLGDGQVIPLPGYPGQPRVLSFSHRRHQLVTTGGTRVVGWDLDLPRPESRRSEYGLESRVPLTVVAWHPARALVAAGYHNGAVVLYRPGANEPLFIKASGSGPVRALVWAPDGSSLALGTEEGEVAVVAMPAEVLRMAQAA